MLPSRSDLPSAGGLNSNPLGQFKKAGSSSIWIGADRQSLPSFAAFFQQRSIAVGVYPVDRAAFSPTGQAAVFDAGSDALEIWANPSEFAVLRLAA